MESFIFASFKLFFHLRRLSSKKINCDKSGISITTTLSFDVGPLKISKMFNYLKKLNLPCIPSWNFSWLIGSWSFSWLILLEWWVFLATRVHPSPSYLKIMIKLHIYDLFKWKMRHRIQEIQIFFYKWSNNSELCWIYHLAVLHANTDVEGNAPYRPVYTLMEAEATV